VAHAQRLPIQNFEDQSLIDSWRERYRRSVFAVLFIASELVGPLAQLGG